MSEFKCPVVRVKIVAHDNADSLEIALVGGYNCVVKKGAFRDGDLAVYLPEQSVLPDWLLKELGFWDDMNNKGTLTSSAGNRIKAIKLRGVLSQGILVAGMPYSETEAFFTTEEYEGNQNAAFLAEDEDAAQALGVTKYEPPVPMHMAGKVAGGDLDATMSYDFDNLKAVPYIFEAGEQVAITEKLHGTLCQVGLIPQRIWEGKSWAEKAPLIDVLGNYRGVVTSKGLGKRGLLLDPSDTTNLYVDMVNRLDLWERLLNCVSLLGLDPNLPIFLVGEIYGYGVQDLTYGTTDRHFRAFDLYVGDRSTGYFVSWQQFHALMNESDIETVPHLAIGPFSKELVDIHTNGNTTLTNEKHMREGVVIKAVDEGTGRWGRKIAKSVSEAYLLRKNATEFN